MSDAAHPPVEIRTGRSAGHVFVIAVQFGFGGIAAFAAVRGIVNGAGGGKLWLVLAAGLAALGFGAYHLHVAMDRRVQVRLGPDGLTDFRSGGVTIPWDVVERVAYLPGHGSATAAFVFNLSRPIEVGYETLTGSGNASEFLAGPNAVRVETTSLDIHPRRFLQAVIAFAPHVQVDPLFAPR
jgi:hypothetical protein